MRHNRARVKVRPVDSKGDVNIAKIRQGLISNVEYLSSAEAIYDYAGEMATSCGYGAWRVLTHYTEENPFLQEIFLSRIKNPFLVYMDSNAKSEVYADAQYGFVLEKVTREEFEERYPDNDPPGDALKTGKGVGQEIWFEHDAFFIADYYVIESEKKTMCLMDDGRVVEKEEAERIIREAEEQRAAVEGLSAVGIGPIGQRGPIQGQAGQVAPMGAATPMPPPLPPVPTITKEREVEYPRVRHYAITADQVLDGPNDVPGRYIPLILLRGPERNIEGKTYTRSLIRDAKDPQRLLNFWVTDSAEIVDMIPKAPWIGTPKQFEGFENFYAQANVDNQAFLPYNQDGNARPLPSGSA